MDQATERKTRNHSSLPRPPRRGRVARGDLGRAQRDQMAPLVGISPDFGALAAAHVAFQFMDPRRLRSPHDVERHRLMRVAAEAFHFEIAKPGVATQSTGCALGEDIRRMIERKAVTLVAGSRLRLRACRCRSGCNQGAALMPTRWLSLFGSPRDSRPGDGQAINGDGLGHPRHSCCVTVGYSVCSVSVKAKQTLARPPCFDDRLSGKRCFRRFI